MERQVFEAAEFGEFLRDRAGEVVATEVQHQESGKASECGRDGSCQAGVGQVEGFDTGATRRYPLPTDERRGRQPGLRVVGVIQDTGIVEVGEELPQSPAVG